MKLLLILMTLIPTLLLCQVSEGEEIDELMIIEVEQDKILHIQNEDLWLWSEIQKLEARIDELENKEVCCCAANLGQSMFYYPCPLHDIAGPKLKEEEKLEEVK